MEGVCRNIHHVNQSVGGVRGSEWEERAGEWRGVVCRWVERCGMQVECWSLYVGKEDVKVMHHAGRLSLQGTVG